MKIPPLMTKDDALALARQCAWVQVGNLQQGEPTPDGLPNNIHEANELPIMSYVVDAIRTAHVEGIEAGMKVAVIPLEDGSQYGFLEAGTDAEVGYLYLLSSGEVIGSVSRYWKTDDKKGFRTIGTLYKATTISAIDNEPDMNLIGSYITRQFALDALLKNFGRVPTPKK